MIMRKLGRNGPTVSALGLGCMGMTGIYGEPNDVESVATIHRAIELGMNLIVTSDAYGAGTNEELVGRAIRGKRDQVLVATKFGNLGMGGVKLPEGLSPGHPDYVVQACDASLKRLGIEMIDLYGLHRVDPKVPIEDTIGAMKRLIEPRKGTPLPLSPPRSPAPSGAATSTRTPRPLPSLLPLRRLRSSGKRFRSARPQARAMPKSRWARLASDAGAAGPGFHRA